MGTLIVISVIIFLIALGSSKGNDKKKDKAKKTKRKTHPSNVEVNSWPKSLPSSHSGETYLINYKDHDGEITSREITVNNIYRDNYTTYIKAYCSLRKEERTFRLERIVGYITNAETGELLDPEELSPLKRKTVIPVEKSKSAVHLQISGDLLHHPNDNVSIKAEREKLGLIPYQYKVDLYRAAINKTIDSGSDTLFLYANCKYNNLKNIENYEKITIVQIDLLTPEGRAKKKLLESL